MTKETFLPHPTLPELMLGNLGTVVSLHTRKLTVRDDGYVVVGLKSGVSGRPNVEKVHRLVAQTFIPNPLKLREVNHINHQKADNRVENLEWVSHADNLKKARAFHGNWTTGEKVCKAVLATPINGGPAIHWPSARAWAISSGNHRRAANVCHAIKSGKASCGFYWSYVTPQSMPQEVVQSAPLAVL